MAYTTNGDDEMLSGINVTPLVDITLVLLIVFMVTAKLIASSTLPMDLPKAATSTEQQIVFAVDLSAAGAVSVDGRPLGGDDEVLALARQARARAPDLRAVIRADEAVPHGRVVRVMDLLNQADVGRIAFAVTPVAPAGG
jgi:biopolymer transport protein ExbD